MYPPTIDPPPAEAPDERCPGRCGSGHIPPRRGGGAPRKSRGLQRREGAGERVHADDASPRSLRLQGSGA
eukprot:7964596-Pyramimonas_sp.AAC.1